jgi:hypothetical protein
MPKETFPKLAKNLGGAFTRKPYDHTLASPLQVARPFMWNGVQQTTGSAFNLASKGCDDATAKRLWEQGYLDLT